MAKAKAHQFVILDVDFSVIEGLIKGIKGARKIVMKELSRAMLKTILDIERTAKQRCPVDTGRLRASITPDIKSPFEGYVGTNVAYAAAVEYGGRPHTIKPRKAKVLRFEVGGTKGGYTTTKTGKKRWKKGKEGQIIFAKKVQHPGTQAKPFLEPAYRKGGAAAAIWYKSALNRSLRKLQKVA